MTEPWTVQDVILPDNVTLPAGRASRHEIVRLHELGQPENYLMYCACCGDPVYLECKAHSPCLTCKGQPNYCDRCGRFIGSKEHIDQHARLGCMPKPEEV